MLDDLTEEFYKRNEDVVQILCLSPCYIPHKIKEYIEQYAYEIKVIIREVIENNKNKIGEKVDIDSSDGSVSYSNLGELSGDSLKEGIS